MTIETIKTTNLTTDKGNKAKNQFNLSTTTANYFKSYGVILAKLDKRTGELFVAYDALHKSQTTTKWLNTWLREYGMNSDLAALSKDKKDKFFKEYEIYSEID